MKNLYLIFLCLFCFTVNGAQASEKDPKNPIIKQVSVLEANTVILYLQNGMKVCLKQTACDDEVVVHLTAKGGYRQLPESQRASGQISPQVAIRSGIGEYYYDKLYALLYEHSIDFDVQVMPFNRDIEGKATGDDIGILMNLIKLFFTKNHFSKYSFDRVKAKTLDQYSRQNKDSRRGFEEAYTEFNNADFGLTKALTKEDFKASDYGTAKEFFKKNFRNPAEFYCVITGAFNMEKMIAQVSRSLAEIPPEKKPQISYDFPSKSGQPVGIKTKVVENKLARGEIITALTLPVKIDVTNQNFISLENIATLLRMRLKTVLRKTYGNDIAVNVTVEYPFYPSLKSPSIKILYISPSKLVSEMGQTILFELKNLQESSVSDQEIVLMQGKYKKRERLREEDNFYWIVVLSNYIMWDWTPSNLVSDLKPMSDRAKIQAALKTYFSLDHYTIISSSG